MATIEKQDIQGFVLKAYGRMCNTRFALLRVEDPGLARAWLSQFELQFSDGNHPANHTCLNVAFTFSGLKALGVSDASLRQFSREFREGMTETHRQRLLGDLGVDSPENWRWGGERDDGTGKNDIHVLLLVFAKDAGTLRNYWAQLEPALAEHRLGVVARLDGERLKGEKEHFGFHDGISQPQIRGLHPGTDPAETVAPGEFILGYENEYGVQPESPIVPASPQQGDVNLLPTVAPGLKDLGRNGSYLVFRQMEQHVGKFREFMRRHSTDPGDPDGVRLASKMVGRWPSGASLTLHPDADPGPHANPANDFGYAQQDQAGLRCPLGAHVRRANPRDAFEENSARTSLSITRKRRILRRGRPYKQQSPLDPKVEEVGIHFLCFNSDISHQFEFIQHTWCNYPQFNRLHHDPDPIIGAVADAPPDLAQDFTVQGCPVNARVQGLERFVTVRGGAYFFFPSFNALRYFASL